MSSFRDLKNASSRDSKIVRDFASSDICVFWVFHKLVITPLPFWKGYLPYIPPSCASSDCRENCHWSTAFSVLPDNYPPGMILRHFQPGNTEHLAASTRCIVFCM